MLSVYFESCSPWIQRRLSTAAAVSAGWLAAFSCLAALPLVSQYCAIAAADPLPTFELARECPPSFELVDGNACRFRSLYDFYNASPASGGLRVQLPPLRDGFSPEQIDLGRYLFFDPLLSGNHRLSCAQCHNPNFGFADGRARSLVPGGVQDGKKSRHDVLLPRSAPTLWNVGFLSSLFWDGRAHSLEEQARGPLFSKDEMATTELQLESDLNGQSTYRQLFSKAFHLGDTDTITVELITRALAAFETTLVSVNSAYDRYAHGDDDALTEQQKRGFGTFRGVIVSCSQCHTPPLFSNDETEVTGVPNAPGLRFDAGAGKITKEADLRGAFKTPTLRNIARTAPYMHAGQFATLTEAVRFYNDRPGHAAPADQHLKFDWRMVLRRPVLSEHDISDVVAFLGALTDESLMPAVPERVPSGLRVVARARHADLAQATGAHR
jgi:cytochrome c peroxidase